MARTAMFDGLDDGQLADIWYALAGAEINHPGCFTAVLEASNDELLMRKGNELGAFVEARFRAIRAVDSKADREANDRAASEAG